MYLFILFVLACGMFSVTLLHVTNKYLILLSLTQAIYCISLCTSALKLMAFCVKVHSQLCKGNC